MTRDGGSKEKRQRVNQLTQRVSELEKMEPAFREAESLTKLLEFAPHAVFLLDLSGRVVFANKTGAAHLGRSIEEIVGSCLREQFPTDVSESRRLKGMEAIRLKKAVNFEDRVGDRWYYNTVYPIMNDRDEVTHLAVYGIDITDRKGAEQSLRLSEEKMRSIFGAAPIGIGVVVNRVFTEVNQRFCEMTGYVRDELINHSARMIYQTDRDFELVGREKYLQIAEGGAGTVETRLRRKDGSVIDVLLSSTPIDPSDLLRGVTFTALDITDRKRAEKEREGLQAQLLQAQKMEAVGRLAGGVAHDLNNLLSPILGFGEILQLDIAQHDGRRRAVDEIVQAAFRAKDVVRQMLAFSRKQTIVIKVANLNEVVKGFVKLLRRSVREDIEIRILSDPDLPSVRVDVGQIEQVIMNLAVNAQDAMPDGGVLTIRMTPASLDEDFCTHHLGSKPGSYTILSVSDTGCGMDRETTEHVFEPFFTTKGEHGTGLGLATVYGIVKQHEGHISVDSEPGKGTTFRVYLPAAAEAAGEAEEAVKGPTDLRGTETVLVVEDSDQIRVLSQSILKRLGYTVLLAKNGREALSVLEKHDEPVALLLTDVVMPDMNGRELFERACSRFPSLKVLYMTGYSGDVLSHRGVVEEGVRIIQKPFSVHALADKIREVLDHP
jgi:two-component system cell cycle sensor histidine kinase/response regulator CckA